MIRNERTLFHTLVIYASTDLNLFDFISFSSTEDNAKLPKTLQMVLVSKTRLLFGPGPVKKASSYFAS